MSFTRRFLRSAHDVQRELPVFTQCYLQCFEDNGHSRLLPNSNINMALISTVQAPHADSLFRYLATSPSYLVSPAFVRPL